MASWMMRLGAAALFAVALGGCASSPPKDKEADVWVGGDDAHLAADKASCRQESASIDPNAINGYSDPRYGVTSALAASVAHNDPLTDHSAQARAAAFAACMGDKGWHQP